ncbi:ribosomal-protein-alanine acetyltransferase [Lucifera butyrica]|uniref:[Ribosomal protein bS18]-alanine N-acetyltransferase n=1 Tax=Lucifera butyrica TaxID=1351585 RepID=A0A498R2Y4_9FIRM|nr:ribosomal protein S18-alanine N-acetyltransferase [Lucifera butyrica]VBB05824.1 ribosomal-protein-alanine acetyltransferase [Lucifera butyrica]
MSEIRIRNMIAADIDAVVEVERQSFQTPWSRQAFESEILDNDLAHYLVVDDAGRVAGYAGMWLILDEAHVTNIAILPGYRSLGLGRRLLQVLIDYAKTQGAKSMTLEVRKSNAPAQNLYRELGFVSRGVRPGYYTDTQEDAIIMWKDAL